MIRLERDAHPLQATLIFDPIDALILARENRFARALGDVRFYAISGVDANTGLPVVLPGGLRLETVRNPSGYTLFFNRLALPDGTPYSGGLPNGVYTFEARGGYYQPLLLPNVVVPQHAVAQIVALHPGTHYVFPPGITVLRGTLYSDPLDLSSPPIVGADVAANGFPALARSSSKGNWVLWFDLNPGAVVDIALTATLPDTTQRVKNNVRLQSGQQRVISDL